MKIKIQSKPHIIQVTSQNYYIPLIKIQFSIQFKTHKTQFTYSKFSYPLKPKKNSIAPLSPFCQSSLHLQEHPIASIACISFPLGSVSFQFFLTFGMPIGVSGLLIDLFLVIYHFLCWTVLILCSI